MHPFLIVILVLGLAAVIAVVWDVRTDGYRAHPVDPELRQRLLDREEAHRAFADAQAALAASRTPVVPPQLAAWRDAPHVGTRRTRIRAHRVVR